MKGRISSLFYTQHLASPARAIKHVCELTNLHKEKDNNLNACILFIVSRNDCTSFRPADECDLLFSQVLYQAHKSGVKVLAYDINLNGQEIFLGKRLPVNFREGAKKKIDSKFLKKVLDAEKEGRGKK